MMTLKAFLISAFLVASGAYAADLTFPSAPDPEIKTVNGAKEVWIKTTDGQPFKMGDLEVLPKGSQFFHWADYESAARWAGQGKVDAGEIKALDGGEGAVGGGFYASSDFWDSSRYGPKLTVFTTTQDTSVLTNPTLAKLSDWNGFNEKLVSLGIDGIGQYTYPKDWFNFFDAHPLVSARAAIWKDFEESDYAKTAEFDLTSIIAMNARIPLEETPWVKSKFPEISQLLNHSFDVSKLDPQVKDQIIQWLMYFSTNQDQTPLTKSVRSAFISEVTASLKTSYNQAMTPPPPPSPGTPPTFPGKTSEWSRTGKTLDTNIQASRKLGIPYSSWLPGLDQPVSLFPSIDLSLYSSSNAPTLPYSKTINENLAYLNLDDFLKAIAQGKPIDKIYDSPGLTPYSARWKTALQSVQTSSQDPALNLHRTLTGSTSADYRAAPAGSDGDIEWQGKKYFQVNDEQSQALKKNPFITPEFQTIADPAHAEKTIQVARYDYPTAADFEKFADFLSDATKQTLVAAKSAGTLKDPTTPEARALTKRMLMELSNVVISQLSGLGRIDAKLFLLSIHPFDEMNTETASATASTLSSGSPFYRDNRTIPGKPDEALLVSRENYHTLSVENSVNSAAIQNAFARAEKDNPQFPRYFDVPEIWQVGRKIAEIGPDSDAFVQQSKAIYAAKPIASCVMKTIDADLNQGIKK